MELEAIFAVCFKGKSDEDRVAIAVVMRSYAEADGVAVPYGLLDLQLAVAHYGRVCELVRGDEVSGVLVRSTKQGAEQVAPVVSLL
ncbi:hypothetical protein OG452_14115 [Streptomyces sp. NBC_01197]|nr:hypothetical protein OG452_14115 [Streptomyces sp. NBC_01197]